MMVWAWRGYGACAALALCLPVLFGYRPIELMRLLISSSNVVGVGRVSASDGFATSNPTAQRAGRLCSLAQRAFRLGHDYSSSVLTIIVKPAG